MKNRTGQLAVTMVLTAMLLLAGCSPKPSTSDVKNAITAELQNTIPVSWVGNLLGGSNAKIESIEIQQWGDYNKEEEYWPVKVRVVGTAELNDPFNQGKVKNFDKISDYRLTKDDYGTWKAELLGGMFQ